jgi:DtxR family Mn-dependent transcriptional regulator
MPRDRKAKANSESVDDYLKAIFYLGDGGTRRIGSKELAERLQVAMASVTNMIQKLASARNSLVDYERHRGVCLSRAGRRRALEIIRHHRLIETFLYEMLNYPIDKVHDEAERLEHFISEDFEQRIAEKLGNPQFDPHGHCIPALDGTMPEAHRVACKCE